MSNGTQPLEKAELRIVAAADDALPLDALARSLSDLVVLHDVILLATDDQYSRRPVSSSVFRRDRRRPRHGDRVTVERLELKSPLQVVLGTSFEHYLVLAVLLVLLRYGNSYASALGKRHAEIDADPLRQQHLEADIDYRREQMRQLRIANDRAERKAIGREATVTLNGQPDSTADLESEVEQLLHTLGYGQTRQVLQTAIDRVNQSPLKITEMDLSARPDDDDQGPG